ncbi:MAG: DUF1684 domain-containing protein [Ktedonobacterales bacterium]
MQPPAGEPTWLDLYDYRERTARLYREREAAQQRGRAPATTLALFRAAKDALFRAHPQSALPRDARAEFAGLRYFAYAPDLVIQATLTPLPPEHQTEVAAPSSGPHAMPLRRAASVRFSLDGTQRELTVFWIDVYGGGLFLPFRDATSAHETYGAGRYLFDTVKGSSFTRLGTPPDDGDRTIMGYPGGVVLLDFNYAYNPSCCYDTRWACPLAPRENWLDAPIRAGERDYHAADLNVQ